MESPARCSRDPLRSSGCLDLLTAWRLAVDPAAVARISARPARRHAESSRNSRGRSLMTEGKNDVRTCAASLPRSSAPEAGEKTLGQCRVWRPANPQLPRISISTLSRTAPATGRGDAGLGVTYRRGIVGAPRHRAPMRLTNAPVAGCGASVRKARHGPKCSKQVDLRTELKSSVGDLPEDARPFSGSVDQISMPPNLSQHTGSVPQQRSSPYISAVGDCFSAVLLQSVATRLRPRIFPVGGLAMSFHTSLGTCGSRF